MKFWSLLVGFCVLPLHWQEQWPWLLQPPWPRTVGSTWNPETWGICSPVAIKIPAISNYYIFIRVLPSKLGVKRKQTSFSSSLFGPKISRRCCACSVERPSRLHLRFSNTSSRGMFSCREEREEKQHNCLWCRELFWENFAYYCCYYVERVWPKCLLSRMYQFLERSEKEKRRKQIWWGKKS